MNQIVRASVERPPRPEAVLMVRLRRPEHGALLRL